MSVIFTKKRSKNISNFHSKVDSFKYYSVNESLQLIKDSSFVKFNETLELVMNLSVDPKHSDQMVRGMVNLPAGTGKNVKVAVICKDDKIAVVRDAGADFYGSTDLIDQIKNGKIDFDVCIATPDMMSLVGQVAKILGPKGLMPNPKLGTVTTNIDQAVKNAKSGQVEFRVEKNGIIHAGIGKLSFSNDDLFSNVKAIVSAIISAKPSGAKGTYVKSMYLSSTMGPALRINLSELSILS